MLEPAYNICKFYRNNLNSLSLFQIFISLDLCMLHCNRLMTCFANLFILGEIQWSVPYLL